jgi:hypothetical protein
MAYHVEIEEAVVLAYLCHPDRGLAEADVDTLLGFLEGLAHTGETYRNDLSRRCTPGSPNFEVEYIFADSAGKLRVFRFIVSDAAAPYGILRVRYAEER